MKDCPYQNHKIFQVRGIALCMRLGQLPFCCQKHACSLRVRDMRSFISNMQFPADIGMLSSPDSSRSSSLDISGAPSQGGEMWGFGNPKDSTSSFLDYGNLPSAGAGSFQETLASKRGFSLPVSF